MEKPIVFNQSCSQYKQNNKGEINKTQKAMPHNLYKLAHLNKAKAFPLKKKEKLLTTKNG